MPTKQHGGTETVHAVTARLQEAARRVWAASRHRSPRGDFERSLAATVELLQAEMGELRAWVTDPPTRYTESRTLLRPADLAAINRHLDDPELESSPELAKAAEWAATHVRFPQAQDRPVSH